MSKGIKNFTKEEGNLIKELYLSGKYSRKELAQFFPGRTVSQCINYIRNNNVVLSHYAKWTEQEEQKLKELVNMKIYSYTKLCKFFPDKNRLSILVKCRSLGLSNDTVTNKIYSFNENYFNILTLENIYWGGFFCADGCVIQRGNSYIFSWVICEKDKEHMELFSSQINSNHPIKRILKASKDFSPKTFVHYRLVITRAISWKKSLENNFGIIQHKTKRFPPPDLKNNKEKIAYMKGYIDGDGCITISSKENNQFTINICSCNKELLVWMKSFVDNLTLPSIRSIPTASNVLAEKNKNAYTYGIRGYKAAIFHELCMRTKTPYLNRKWENPEILEIIKYWKSKPEWPNEIFFQNILNG